MTHWLRSSKIIERLVSNQKCCTEVFVFHEAKRYVTKTKLSVPLQSRKLLFSQKC